MINSVQTGVRVLAYSSGVLNSILDFTKGIPTVLSIALAGSVGLVFVAMSSIWVLWLTKITRMQGAANHEE